MTAAHASWVLAIAAAIFCLAFPFWLFADPAPESCAAHWAAHPAADHHTWNREHHVRVRCTP